MSVRIKVRKETVAWEYISFSELSEHRMIAKEFNTIAAIIESAQWLRWGWSVRWEIVKPRETAHPHT